MAMSNKFIKRRDKHEVTSASGKTNNSVMEARISIHINDESVNRSQYEPLMRDLCSRFGKIKTIHVPGKSKKGNLVFVEFVNESEAEKAIKFINSDRELRMVANKARPPMNQGDNGSRRNENIPPAAPKTAPQLNRMSQNTNFSNSASPRFIPSQLRMPERREEPQSWRSPRDSDANRPSERLPRMPRHVSEPKNNFRAQIPAKNDIPNSNVGQCNRCQRRAELKCQRCGDFYCSHTCQKVDWPAHKRQCFPMPDLVPATDPPVVVENVPKPSPSPKMNNFQSPPAVEKIDVKKPSFELPLNIKKSSPIKQNMENNLNRMIVFCDDDPKSGDIVAITWPCSTNRVYLVQNEGKMGIEYRQVLTWASRPENHGPPFDESPEKGTLVFAEFENDWFRAIVQKVIDAENVLVAFFDFGNAEQLHYTQLRQYTNPEDPVRYTYGVYLKDCPYDAGNPLPEIVKEYLKSLSDQFTPLRIRYNGEWNRTTNVELFVAETDVCVNDKILALLGTSRAESRKNREEMNQKLYKQQNPVPNEKIYFDDLQCERMTTENKTRVKVLCCDDLQANSIWCCLETAIASLKEIQTTVDEFCSYQRNLVPYIPERDELCLVRRNENHFERAVLVEIDEEKARVLLIDSGGLYFVTKDSIFKFDKSLCKPLYTHMCQIQGFPSVIEGDLLDFLKEELDEASFIVHEIEFNEEEECYILNMPKLLKEATALEYLADDEKTITETIESEVD